MQAALAVLSEATLLLISTALVLALFILVLHEARHVIRLSMRLRSYVDRLRRDEERRE